MTKQTQTEQDELSIQIAALTTTTTTKLDYNAVLCSTHRRHDVKSLVTSGYVDENMAKKVVETLSEVEVGLVCNMWGSFCVKGRISVERSQIYLLPLLIKLKIKCKKEEGIDGEMKCKAKTDVKENRMVGIDEQCVLKDDLNGKNINIEANVRTDDGGSKTVDSNRIDNKIGDGKGINTKTIDSKIIDSNRIDNKIGDGKGINTKTMDSKIIDRNRIDNKIMDDKAINTKTVNNKIVDSKATNNKIMDTKTVDSKAINNKIVDSKATNNKIVDSNRINTKTMDSKTVDSKAINNKIVDSKATNNKIVDSNRINTKTMDSKTVDSKAINNKIVDSKATNNKTVDNKIMDNIAINTKILDSKAIDNKAVDTKTVDNNDNKTVDSSKKEIENTKHELDSKNYNVSYLEMANINQKISRTIENYRAENVIDKNKSKEKNATENNIDKNKLLEKTENLLVDNPEINRKDTKIDMQSDKTVESVKSGDQVEHTVKAIILVSKKTSAEGIEQLLNKLNPRVRTIVAAGGTNIFDNIEKIERGVDVMLCTAGRLCYLLQKKIVRSNHLIVEDADLLMLSDTLDKFNIIISLVEAKTTWIFASKFNTTLRVFVESFLPKYKFINLELEVPQSKHFYVVVDRRYKFICLKALLARIESPRFLIYCNSIGAVRTLSVKLDSCTSVHTGMPQRMLNEIRIADEVKHVVLNDVHIAGQDFKLAKCAINFDIPVYTDQYISRIVRLGRLETVVNIFCDDELIYKEDIEKRLGKKLIAFGDGSLL